MSSSTQQQCHKDHRLPDPTGTYTVYSWNTTDAHTAGCPCFGDYDNLGADNNGIYVTTAELGIASGAANGVIVYAISKQQLEDGARVGVIPPVIGYRLTSDPLGTPFVVAPAMRNRSAGARRAFRNDHYLPRHGRIPGPPSSRRPS